MRVLTILSFLLLGISTTTHCQDIEIKVKKKKISLNGKQLFKFERENNGNDIIIYRIADDEIFIKNIDKNNGTSSISDDYRKFIFMGTNKFMETTKFNGFPVKYFFKKLVKRKVINAEGEIDEARLDKFIEEYDENISERTIHVR